MKINVGSGIHKKEGYVNCDIAKDVGADHVFDAGSHRWPFEEDSVDEVLCENLLEHLSAYELDHFFEQAWRVLKDKGNLNLVVPHFMSYTAYYDPDHVRFFTPNSFIYWSRTCRGSDGRPVVRGDCDFDVKEVKQFVNKDMLEKYPELMLAEDCPAKHWWGVFEYIACCMVAVKPVRES